MGKKLVIVESPTKARTIKKFLGKDYIVESCMGHIRDLPQSAKDIPEKYKKQAWSNLGVNTEKNFEPIYCVPRTKAKIIKTLKEKLKEVDELILATDEDREGESISWHLIEVLKPKVPFKRMVFHEITKSAIEKSLKEFRDIDDNLVRAQEARRVLDRLVGYTISPLLWKKISYGLSAGRVQSVAVTLISQREHERLRFKKAEYSSITGKLSHKKINFDSRLVEYKGQRIAVGKDFSDETGRLIAGKEKLLHLKQDLVQKINSHLSGNSWKVISTEEKPMSRNPAPPFITSTLQQEANGKLNLGSRETMQVAQKLYERGFITYMRTDSINLSDQAIKAARKEVASLYGKEYLPPQPRVYKKKSKGAQEAHEAIRPAGTEFVHPDQTSLTGVQKELYSLIWKRTMASQMKNSEHLQLNLKFKVGDCIFSSSGMTIQFPGFLKAYVEESSEEQGQADNKESYLPQLKKGEEASCNKIESQDHETKPPARFSEASLIKKMEQEGIGRPSTYASIITTIQSRGYVEKVGKAMVPTFTALAVSKLLRKHLPNYVDTNFTSQMEGSLDDIAQGNKNWVDYLSKIYFGGEGLKSQVEYSEKNIDADESRAIELDGLEEFSFRVGRYGAYVCRVDKKTGEEVCASLAIDHYPGDFTAEMANKLIDQKIKGHDALGIDPDSQLSVYALTGRYGPYVQLGDMKEEKPKRMSISAPMDISTISLEEALQLLSLPKTLGEHPETKKPVKVGLGRFGPYVVHDGDYRSIPKTENIFEVDFEKALEMLSQPKKSRRGAAVLKKFANHPNLGEAVTLHTGKYGPYVKCGKINASLPEDLKPEDLSQEQAFELLSSKKSSKKSSRKKASKKKVSQKKTAKKSIKKAKTVLRRRKK